MKTNQRERGFALFFGLVFLLMMTLVAVTAMRGTAIELNMANNIANYERAFERAESGRVAFSKITPDLMRCFEVWPQGINLIGGGGANCVPGQCLGEDSEGGGVGAYNANFPIEPGMQIGDSSNVYTTIRAGEGVDDPTQFVNEYRLVGSDGDHADIAVVPMGPWDEGGGDSSTLSGYGGSRDRTARSLFFEFVSSSDIAGTLAAAAAHYRYPVRETGECLGDLSYGGVVP